MYNYNKPRVSIQDLKGKIFPQSYYESELGAPIKRYGSQLIYPCPFHSDGKTPNFVITTNGKYQDQFKCFSAQCGPEVFGDFIRFHQLRYNLTLPEALESLARTYAPELLDQPPPKHRRRTKTASKYGFKQEVERAIKKGGRR